ncbi:NUDIX domain-containing protein [Pseudomonas putida]|uniref:NUDIX domain-containing protein n=1 Tax=Pseudomonas putida TaxID=303 RepID=A0AAP9MWI6_PSEPU|nr:NUDIX domain-containing protein [Pseudomonas putida]QJQ08718.1 NUDIX domain-containing protein [Pseudomonas putida]
MKLYFLENITSKIKSILGSPSLGVKAVIFNNKQQVLLIQHTYRVGWHLPGGGIIAGETPRGAVCREVLEETGLTISNPLLTSVLLNKWRYQHDYVLLYKVTDFLGFPEIQDHHEIENIGWFNLNRLPDGITSSTRSRISEILNGDNQNDHW